MGKRGPAKKPSALEKLQGNPGKRKPNKKEPKPDSGIPPVPRWLDGVAKYFFKEVGIVLDDMHVLTKADKKALELAADAYSEYREARQFIQKNGHTYESHTKWGILIKQYPQVKIASDAWRRCSDMLKQFGLTPSTRTGVQMRPETELDPMEEFLNSGGKPYAVR